MGPIFDGRDQQGVGMTSNSINSQYNQYGSPEQYGGYPQGGGFNTYDSYNQDAVMEKYFGGYQGSKTDQYSNPGNLDPYLTESLDGQSGHSQPQFGRSRQYEAPQQPLNDMTALARIQAISGELDKQTVGEIDENIGVQDLKSALEDDSGKYSKDDKEAIRYFLENKNGLRGRLDSFDGNGDGLFRTDTINKVVANPNAQPEKTAEQKMSNTEAIRTLKDYLQNRWKKGVDREELSRMQNDEKLSENERLMAKKLLKNEELFKAGDTGKDKDDNYDGFISYKDCDKLLNRSDLDKIGNGGSGGYPGSGQPVVQGGYSSYPPANTGNYNLDYYYNSVFGGSLGPAADIFRNAPGGQAA